MRRRNNSTTGAEQSGAWGAPLTEKVARYDAPGRAKVEFRAVRLTTGIGRDSRRLGGETRRRKVSEFLQYLPPSRLFRPSRLLRFIRFVLHLHSLRQPHL